MAHLLRQWHSPPGIAMRWYPTDLSKRQQHACPDRCDLRQRPGPSRLRGRLRFLQLRSEPAQGIVARRHAAALRWSALSARRQGRTRSCALYVGHVSNLPVRRLRDAREIRLQKLDRACDNVTRSRTGVQNIKRMATTTMVVDFQLKTRLQNRVGQAVESLTERSP